MVGQKAISESPVVVEGCRKPGLLIELRDSPVCTCKRDFDFGELCGLFKAVSLCRIELGPRSFPQRPLISQQQFQWPISDAYTVQGLFAQTIFSSPIWPFRPLMAFRRLLRSGWSVESRSVMTAGILLACVFVVVVMGMMN